MDQPLTSEDHARQGAELRALSPSQRTRRLCSEYGLRAVKSLGQNFLTDDNVARKIAAAALELSPSHIIEIGPGLGALTVHLASGGVPVAAFEKDPKLQAPLEALLDGLGNVRLVMGDFLSADLGEYASASLVAVGNLPYYITTPILERLFELEPPPMALVLTMQREVGERLRARPGTSDYGSLSVYAAYCLEGLEEVCRLGPGVFSPEPQVQSVALRLTPRRRPPEAVISRPHLFSVVRAAFGYRRKTLRNALAQAPGVALDGPGAEALLVSAAIDPGCRGETLSLEQFIALGNALAVREGMRP